MRFAKHQIDLLASLQTVHWRAAFRTYWNSHATLIGLLVVWWIGGAPENRWAFDAAPSFGHLERGIGGGMCDVILGQANESRGVVEVEGTRYLSTLDKLGMWSPWGQTDLEFSPLRLRASSGAIFSQEKF